MRSTSEPGGIRGLIQAVADQLPRLLGGRPPAGQFVERSRGFYATARLSVHTSGAVAITVISVLQGWWLGLVVALLAGALAVDGFMRRKRPTSVTGELLADITVMGIAMVLIGIPTVAAVLAIVMTFLAALLLDRRKAALVSIYIVGWAAAAYVVSTLRVELSEPAANPVPWIASITVFGVVMVLVVARRVVELIGDLEILRAQFLGGVAHDLRNPLTGVIGVASLVREAGSELNEEDRAEMIDMILGQAAEANRMVKDLLVTTHLDASGLELEPRTIDVGQLVDETLSVMLTNVEGCTVDFVMPDRPVLAWADQMRIRQVIHNLVSNAFRYGAGQVRVTIEDLKDRVAVCVTDNGPGIAEEEQESIFAPFARASHGRKHQDSVGLGLSVARRLARLSGGDLTYRRDGDESVFELILPPATLSTSLAMSGRTDVVTTDLAEVWLSDDNIIRVVYHPGAGIEGIDHAAAVVEACARVANGDLLPLMVVPGGVRPDGDARRFYIEQTPPFATAVAIVTTGRLQAGIANLIASRMRLVIPIRVFENQTEAAAWLVDQQDSITRPTAQSL